MAQVNLLEIKQQLDQEIELLTESIQSLTTAKTKFHESGECVKNQASVGDDASILVPLTGSMYVPGKIANKDKFLIEIGTGYYVEMNTKQAADFFARKVKFLDSQIVKYIQIVQERVFMREGVIQQVKSQMSQPAQPAAS